MAQIHERHHFTNKVAEGTRSYRTLWMVVPLVMLLAILAAIYYYSFNGLGFR